MLRVLTRGKQTITIVILPAKPAPESRKVREYQVKADGMPEGPLVVVGFEYTAKATVWVDGLIAVLKHQGYAEAPEHLLSGRAND